jgi:hypothetical protein
VLILPKLEQGTPKRLQPGGEQPHIMTDGAQDGIDGIAVSALEVISFEQAIAFEMAADPVPLNVSTENERFLARLKLFEVEDFADEEVEVHGRADRLCVTSGGGWNASC